MSDSPQKLAYEVRLFVVDIYQAYWASLHKKLSKADLVTLGAAYIRARPLYGSPGQGAALEGLRRDVAEVLTLLKGHVVRREATHLYVGAFVEEPRGTPSQGGTRPVPQLHSGKQLRATLTGTDIDAAPADVSGATATSSDEAQVTAAIEPNGAGGVDLVVTDVAGGNLGSADVTISAGAATVTETFEVIAGDAVALNLGAFAEEDRPA